jgi:hypothetical protein
MQTHGARDSTENRRKKILPDKALEKFPWDSEEDDSVGLDLIQLYEESLGADVDLEEGEWKSGEEWEVRAGRDKVVYFLRLSSLTFPVL